MLAVVSSSVSYRVPVLGDWELHGGHVPCEVAGVGVRVDKLAAASC